MRKPGFSLIALLRAISDYALKFTLSYLSNQFSENYLHTQNFGFIGKKGAIPIIFSFILMSFLLNSQAGAALDFDGIDDRVEIADAAWNDFGAGNFTVECWIKKQAGSTGFSNLTGVGKWNTGATPGSNEWLITLSNGGNNNIPNFTVEVGSTRYTAVATTSLTLGTWYHIAGVREGTTIKIYVNGVLEGSLTDAGITNINDVPGRKVMLGKIDGFAGYTNMEMDELRIWGEARSLAQISGNMNCEIPSSAANLLANYHFNQGVGNNPNPGINTLTDISGNGYDGSLINFGLMVTTSNWVTPGSPASGNACKVHNITQNTYFSSIQAAIGDLQTANGDVISVAAGTYTEIGQIVINKNLTIVGEDKLTTIIKPDGDTPSGDAWILVNSAITFNLEKVTLDGSAKLIYTGLKHQGNGTINNCNFTDIKYNESTDYKGTAIHIVSTETVNVTNCMFTQIGRNGILADECLGTFSGNTYIGKGTGDWLDYFILSEYGDNVTISNNNISDCTGIALVDGSGSSGIAVWDDPNTEAVILGNTLTNNSIGVAIVGINGPTSDPKVTIGDGNIFDGGDFGVAFQNYAGPYTPDVTFTGVSTFKGQTDKAITINDGVSAGIMIDISSAIFKTPGDVVITDHFAKEDLVDHAIDGTNRGLFIWNPNNVYVTPNSFVLPFLSPSIQRGVDASSSGFTVNVQGGNYPENVDTDSPGKNLTLSPGSSPGCVTVTGLTLNSGDALNIEINGTTACTQFDQFIVNGTVTLGGANLALALGYVPSHGDSIKIIDNDMSDAIIGQFAEGSTITVSGHTFTINYTGGDGNDVVLAKCGPRLQTTINGIQVTDNGDGINDTGSFSLCDSPSNNLNFTQFIDFTGSPVTPQVKLVQQFIRTNVSFGPVDAVAPLSAYSPAFSRNVSLVNTATTGTLVMKLKIFFDDNNNNILDPSECTGDSVIYTVTVIPNPVIAKPNDTTACVSYTLPVLSVGNYFTGPGGTGMPLFAGNNITSSQIIYIYAETGTSPNCTNEQSFNVTVNTNTPPSGLSYSENPATYIENSVITDNTPTLSGTFPFTFSSSSLPVGLSIDSGTGIISGTPTAPTVASIYTVTASNSCGSISELVSITVDAIPFAGAGCAMLNEDFSTNPQLANTDVNGAWYPDRYRPASFTADAGSLKISINSADGAQLRPAAFITPFYNTQGRKINQCGKCVTIAEADLFIPADWATNKRRSDLWATAFDVTNAISFYPIIGFRNVTGSNPQMSVWNGSGWDELGPPSAYNTSYSLEARLSGTNVEYLINNVVVGTYPSVGSVYFGDIIMQAYNFNDNTLGASYDAGPNNSYDALWDNLITASGSTNLVTNVTTGDNYCSIQSAVDSASPGDEITASAGTYTENVTINKALTLKGANNGVNGCSAMRTSESKVDGGIGTAFSITADGVTIDGFEINGLTAVMSTGYTNTLIQNNKVLTVGAGINAEAIPTDDYTYTIRDNCINLIAQTAGGQPTAGILINGASGRNAINISNNQIGDAFYGILVNGANTTTQSQILRDTISGVMQGVAIVNTIGGPLAASNVLINGTKVSGFTGDYPGLPAINFHAGVYTYTAGPTVPSNGITLSINDSTMDGTQTVTQSSGGIYLADFSTATDIVQNVIVDYSNILNNTNRGLDARGRVQVDVTNSTFTNNGSAAPGSGGNDGFTIIAQQGASVTATNNYITHPASSTSQVTAFVTGNTPTSSPNNIINATNNSISMNGNAMGKGANNTAGNTINATCNWWDTSCSDIPQLMSGMVTFQPFLSSGLDVSPMLGFQPAFGACNGYNATLSSVMPSASSVCEGTNVSFTANGLVDGDNTFGYTVTGPGGPFTGTLTAPVSGGTYTFAAASYPVGTYNITIDSITIAGCRTILSSNNTASFTVTPLPVLQTSLNGVTVTNVNDGNTDIGSFSVCNGTVNNVNITSTFIDLASVPNGKVYQTVTPGPNTTFPNWCNNCQASVGAFTTGTSATAFLNDPNMPGSVIITFQIWGDANSNNMIDVGECTGDTISYTVTVIPTPNITNLPDITICDSYSLPAITGTNLTINASYFTAPDGAGTRYVANDNITSTQTLYIYEATATNPLCFDQDTFSVTINITPAVDNLSDVTICDSYTLPVLSVGNYYTGSGGTGTALSAGNSITASQTIYIYAETGTTPNCTDENSFIVNINTTPVVDNLSDVTICDSYTLPVLSVGNYYTGSGGTGTALSAGNSITTSQTIYIYAETGTTPNCTDENSFMVTINTTPVVDNLSDVTICDNYILPSLTVGSYFTGSGGTGTPLSAGNSITSPQTIYIYAETGTAPNCTDENSFSITINSAPTFSFTIGGSNVSNVNNGRTDASEASTVEVCDGGTYSLSALTHSNPANRYNIVVSTTGGGMKFNGNTAGNADISATTFDGAQTSYTITLDNPAIAGQVIQVITPYNDVNSNMMLDAGDCAGDPITITYIANPIPVLQTTINGVQLTNDYNGTPETGSFSVCNSTNDNLFFTQFIDAAGILMDDSVKVIQEFTLSNVVFAPANSISPISGYSPSFSRNVSLIDPTMSGTLVMKFKVFFDSNNNNILDGGECTNDSIIYTVTVNPKPTITFAATVTGKTPQVGNNNSGPATVTLNFCQGESFTMSGYSSSPGTQVRILEKVVTANNVTYNNVTITSPGPTNDLNSAFFANVLYGPYGLVSGTSGSVTQTFVPYYDSNNNNMYDAGDCLGDTITQIYNVSATPDAGPDLGACINGTATMAAIGTGTWTEAAGNPSSTTINAPGNNSTTISGFTIIGTYKYVWTVNGCTDTVAVNIQTSPTATISGYDYICSDSTFTITGLPVGGSGMYSSHGWSQSGPGTVAITNNNDGTAEIKGVTPGDVYITYTVTDNSGCTGTAIDTITVLNCANFAIVNDYGINDPCVCKNDQSANGAKDGTFGEVVSISPTMAGETWTVVYIDRLAGTGLLPMGINTNDILTFSSGAHEIAFMHADSSGYAIIVEGPNAIGTPGNVQLSVSNICKYPVVAFDPVIQAQYCETDPIVTLDLQELTGFMGSDTFYINGNQLNRINPDTLPIGMNILDGIFKGTFVNNTSTDVANPAFPGCLTSLNTTFDINAVPTVKFDIGGTSISSINNGMADLSENATVSVCNGGMYTVANLVHSNAANRYLVAVTPSGGGLLFDGNPASSGDITAAQFNSAVGPHTVTLSNPTMPGSLQQVITPYNDVNSSGGFDSGDCLGDPVTINYVVTATPVLKTTINSAQIITNNNGVNDTIFIGVCNGVNNNLKIDSFIIASGGGPNIKIRQIITGNGATVSPWVAAGTALPGAFANSMATASLINPMVAGTLSLKFFAFTDTNGDNIPDPTECKGDTIIYLVTVSPKPTFAFTAMVTGGSAQLVNNNSGPASVTLNMCTGGSVTFSNYSGNPGSQVRFLEEITSGTNNVTYNAIPVTVPRPQNDLDPSFFANIYGPYSLSSGTFGNLTQTIVPYFDSNNNGTFEAGIDCLGDTLTITYNISSTIKPVITIQPVNANVCETQNATLSVTATGPGLYYQWQEETTPGNFTDINPNGNSATLIINNVTTSGKSYRVVIYANYGLACQDSTASLPVQVLFGSDVGLACNKLVNISMGDDCNLDITYDMILKGEYSHTMFSVQVLNGQNQPIGSVINSSFINKLWTVQIFDNCSGNSCWGQIFVEDKLHPVIMCQPDTLINCYDTLDFSKPPYLPQAIDNCTTNVPVYVLEDYTIPYGSCVGDTIAVRFIKYQAIDSSNNLSNICERKIYYKKANIYDILIPKSYDGADGNNAPLSCSYDWELGVKNSYPDPHETGSPYFSGGNPLNTGLYNNGICKIQITFSDEVTAGKCAGSKIIIRKWTIMDWCTRITRIEYQVIKIIDDQGPNFDIPSIPPVITEPYSCTSTFIAPDPINISDCSGTTGHTYTVQFRLDPSCSNTPLPDPYVYFSGPETKSEKILSGPNAGKWRISGLPVGCTWLKYTMTDPCGNSHSKYVKITVSDGTAPVAVCDEYTVVTLSADGKARVYTNSFDEGSYDNCSEITLQVRRMTPGCDQSTTEWNSFIDLCCDDPGRLVQVELKVTDKSGNTNVCMVNVETQDKIQPTLTCPPDLTLSCGADTSAIVTGIPVKRTPSTTGAYYDDNCSNVSLIWTNSGSLNTCGEGIIYRTYKVSDKAGNSKTCTQAITVKNALPYNGPSWAEVGTKSIDGCINTDTDPSKTGKPVYNNVNCSHVSSNFVDQVYSNVDGVCYKIMRKWTVVDWCKFRTEGDPITYRWPSSPVEGINQWTYTQLIKVVDTTKPVLTMTNMGRTYQMTGSECGGLIELKETASDCSPSSTAALKWSFIVKKDNVVYRSGSGTGGSLNASGSYESGSYEITWTAEDQCGNLETKTYTFIIRDNKKPSPYCLSALTTVVMPSAGMVSINARNFDKGSSDNCPGPLKFSFVENYPVSAADSTQVFTCADFPEGKDTIHRSLRMYVWDQARNFEYCTVNIIIQKNAACTPTTSPLSIGGHISTEKDAMMNAVPVYLSDEGTTINKMLKTDNKGSFTFNQLSASSGYLIKPEKNDNHLNGISTLDLVMIQQHILGVKPFTSPYQYLAADANNDNKVTAGDLVEIRKLILGFYEQFPKNTSWRFYGKGQAISDPDQPWGLSESIFLNKKTRDQMFNDFIAVKTGDINTSAVANFNEEAVEPRRFSGILNIDDRKFSKAQTILVPVTTQNINGISGIQGAFDYDNKKMIFKKMIPGVINITQESYRNISDEGTILFSWNSINQEIDVMEKVLFLLEFECIDDGQISSSIYLTSDIVNSEYYGSDLSENNLKLAYVPVNSSELMHVGQNTPNPFTSVTSIPVNLPQEGMVQLKVFDNTGKMIINRSEYFGKGNGEFVIQGNLLNGTGVYFYEIKSHGQSFMKKMIKISQ